jgi:hypothetical protein
MEFLLTIRTIVSLRSLSSGCEGQNYDEPIHINLYDFF